MAKVKVTSLMKGSYVQYKGAPHQVLEYRFHHPGRGGGVAQLKLKNVSSGTVLNESFKSNEQLELIDISSREMQFLYIDGEDVVVMDPRSYDQITIDGSLIAGKHKFLTPDVKLYVLLDNDQPVSVVLPPKVKLKVTTAHDAVAGNTVGAAKKTIEAETGLEVPVPLFIKEGETIVVDTETGEYAGRA